MLTTSTNYDFASQNTPVFLAYNSTLSVADKEKTKHEKQKLKIKPKSFTGSINNTKPICFISYFVGLHQKVVPISL